MVISETLTLPCHVLCVWAFLPQRCSRRRGTMGKPPGRGWEEALVEPFLGRLRRKVQRRWAPLYLKGLILPGERKWGYFQQRYETRRRVFSWRGAAAQVP
jgi:hypothetical protein